MPKLSHMKAAIIKQWGSAKVLEITDIPKPILEPNQLLIKVFASSINPVDWKHRTGNHKYVLGSPFPIVLGYDVCGEVVEIGNEIKNFKTGDLVFGDLDNKYGGALAEYATGHENCFSSKPQNCTNEEAAAIPLAGLTALQALRDKCQVQKGQTVVINGASGGVGHLAVQIAKILGAQVIAICSTSKITFVEKLNAEIIVDYTKENVLESIQKADVFFDVIGNYSFLKTKHILNSGGTYISTLPRPKILLHKLVQPFTRNKKVKTLLRKHISADLKQLATWVDEGKLKVVIDKQFKLDEIQEAHRYAESGRTAGKNTITIE